MGSRADRGTDAERLLGNTNLGGHGDGMYINLREDLAYIGHMGDSNVGTTIVGDEPERSKGRGATPDAPRRALAQSPDR